MSRHFTHLYKRDRARAVCFTQDEQIVIMNSYEEFKSQIKARGNTVAHTGSGGVLAKSSRCVNSMCK